MCLDGFIYIYIYMSALAGQTAAPIMLNIFMETFELGVTYMVIKSFFSQVRFFRKTNFFISVHSYLRTELFSMLL